MCGERKSKHLWAVHLTASRHRAGAVAGTEATFSNPGTWDSDRAVLIRQGDSTSEQYALSRKSGKKENNIKMIFDVYAQLT